MKPPPLDADLGRQLRDLVREHPRSRFRIFGTRDTNREMQQLSRALLEAGVPLARMGSNVLQREHIPDEVLASRAGAHSGMPTRSDSTSQSPKLLVTSQLGDSTTRDPAQLPKTGYDANARADQRASAEKVMTRHAQDESAPRMDDQRSLAATRLGSEARKGAAPSAAPSADYAGRVIASIRANLSFNQQTKENPETEVLITMDAGGRVLSQNIVRESGLPAWDAAVQKAIAITGVLPKDTDGRVPRSMVINFRPRE